MPLSENICSIHGHQEGSEQQLVPGIQEMAGSKQGQQAPRGAEDTCRVLNGQ